MRYSHFALLLLIFLMYSCKKIRPENSNYPSPPEKLVITITTKIPDSITTNCCMSGAEVVTNDIVGIVGLGVCWSTDHNPTAALVTKTRNKLVSGSFLSIVYGLSPNTLYYLRAYVITYADTSYGQEVSFRTPTEDLNLSIGQYNAGGIIFYLDSTMKHGLVCALFDAGVAKWGCELTSVGATSPGIGDGALNTKTILSACAEEKINAKICDSVVINFYDDWYMPSKDELQLMYLNVHQRGKGNFGSIYHSSTECNNSSAWAIDFRQGIPYNLWKGGTVLVRPVRSF
jgi:hypothetical protein